MRTSCESPGPRRALAQLRSWHGPNVVCLSRASVPPIPGLDKENPPADEGEGGGETDGTKQALRGFSLKSSANLSRFLSSVDWRRGGECLHVCLTYGREWPSDVRRVKRSLSMWFARNCEWAVWRLEFQRRGAPHWHLLVWLGGRVGGEFVQALRSWWAVASGNDSPHGVHVTTGDAVRGTWYLAKHAAKSAQAPAVAVGRWWGIVNRDQARLCQDLHCHGEVTERERVWWARLYRRCTGCRTRNAAGLSWYLPRAEQLRVSAWCADQVDRESWARRKDPF